MKTHPFCLHNHRLLKSFLIFLFMRLWYSMIHAIVSNNEYFYNFFFNLSYKGGRDLQIMLDALCSKDGIMGSRKIDYTIQDVPLYWSNVR